MIDHVFDLIETDDFNQESGQGIVEYGLIIGLIAIIVIAVFVALGPQVRNMFQNTPKQGPVDNGEGAVSIENDTMPDTG